VTFSSFKSNLKILARIDQPRQRESEKVDRHMQWSSRCAVSPARLPTGRRAGCSEAFAAAAREPAPTRGDPLDGIHAAALFGAGESMIEWRYFDLEATLGASEPQRRPSRIAAGVRAASIPFRRHSRLPANQRVQRSGSGADTSNGMLSRHRRHSGQLFSEQN
jgi:hypothetical protein